MPQGQSLAAGEPVYHGAGRQDKISISELLGLEDQVRTQDPKIHVTSGKRPRFYIRPYVERLVDGRLARVQERIYLKATAKRDAIREKNEVMATINHSKYVVQSQMNFGEFLDHYLDEYVRKPENLAAGTRGKYESHIKKHIRPAFADLPMGMITTKTIDAWLGEKARAGLSSSTRLDLRNLMSGIFSQARRWGWWKEMNPATDATVGRQRPAREPVKLTVAETRALLAALPADVRLICETALYCTLRISEVLGLQWKHIDFAGGKILVRQRWYRGDLDIVKSKKANRDVPLGALADDLRAMFPGAGRENDFVFNVQTHEGRWKTPGVCRDDRDLNQHFLRPAAIALDIYRQGFGFHTFRREAVTVHGQNMGALQTQRMAGHATADMTQHYTLADFEAQERSVLALQARVRGSKVVSIRAANEPKQAKSPRTAKTGIRKKPSASNALGGGPERTRISDLYRVKVAL